MFRNSCQKDVDQPFSKEGNLLLLNEICLSILNTKMSKLTFPVLFLPVKININDKRCCLINICTPDQFNALWIE